MNNKKKNIIAQISLLFLYTTISNQEPENAKDMNVQFVNNNNHKITLSNEKKDPDDCTKLIDIDLYNRMHFLPHKKLKENLIKMDERRLTLYQNSLSVAQKKELRFLRLSSNDWNELCNLPGTTGTKLIHFLNALNNAIKDHNYQKKIEEQEFSKQGKLTMLGLAIVGAIGCIAQ